LKIYKELSKFKSVFIDTAPIIYYIEAHSKFGPIAKELVELSQSGKIIAFTSVITLAEVLPKPIELGHQELADKFANFLKKGKNISMIDVTIEAADIAGRLKGKHKFLNTMDAIQIGSAINADADVFVTNDLNLKKIKEIKVLALKDFV
jgi:predicted nucleic acid-binding protein